MCHQYQCFPRVFLKQTMECRLYASRKFEAGFVAVHEAEERPVRVRNLVPARGKFLRRERAIIAYPFLQVFFEENRRAQHRRQNLCRGPGPSHRAGNKHIRLDFACTGKPISQTLRLPDTLWRETQVLVGTILQAFNVIAMTYEVEMRQSMTPFVSSSSAQ